MWDGDEKYEENFIPIINNSHFILDFSKSENINYSSDKPVFKFD